MLKSVSRKLRTPSVTAWSVRDIEPRVLPVDHSAKPAPATATARATAHGRGRSSAATPATAAATRAWPRAMSVSLRASPIRRRPASPGAMPAV